MKRTSHSKGWVHGCRASPREGRTITCTQTTQAATEIFQKKKKKHIKITQSPSWGEWGDKNYPKERVFGGLLFILFCF